LVEQAIYDCLERRTLTTEEAADKVTKLLEYLK